VGTNVQQSSRQVHRALRPAPAGDRRRGRRRCHWLMGDCQRHRRIRGSSRSRHNRRAIRRRSRLRDRQLVRHSLLRLGRQVLTPHRDPRSPAARPHTCFARSRPGRRLARESASTVSEAQTRVDQHAAVFLTIDAGRRAQHAVERSGATRRPRGGFLGAFPSPRSQLPPANVAPAELHIRPKSSAWRTLVDRGAPALQQPCAPAQSSTALD
jgi:hypothetical protein